MKGSYDNEVKTIKNAIDHCYSKVDERPSLRSDIYRELRGKVKVKKKLSAGLVLAIVLLLITMSAFAATLLWENYAAQVKTIEHEQGDYPQWPLEEKLSLAQNLLDMGYLVESDTTTKLFDAATASSDKQALVDGLMLNQTGQTDVQEINLDIITYAILGSSDTWTPEKRVWWLEITNMYREDSAPDILLIPNGEEITEEKAIVIAKEAALKAFDLPADGLEKAIPVANLYVTDQRPDYKRWDIQFKIFREDNPKWEERSYCAIVDEDGNIIADPDVGADSIWDSAIRIKELNAQISDFDSPIAKTYMQYKKDSYNWPFWEWSLSTKAAYSAQVRPQVQAALENGDLKAYDASDVGTIDQRIIASTTYAYGVPAEGDLKENDALALALQELLNKYGYTKEDFPDIYPFFDITSLDAPLWKFIFEPDNRTTSDAVQICKVELHARTGEIVLVETIEEKSLLHDLDYDLRWH